MAGRGTDIKLGGNFEHRLNKALEAAGLHIGDLDKLDEIAAIRAQVKERCDKDQAEVLACGGLYVLGTERHEARRIDNQLRGRSGRQGDVGESRFYLSLQDDLMRIFYRDWVTNAMERLGMAEGVPIESGMVTRAIARAQKKVEDRNFEIRKNLLEYDEVMDQQRKTIYGVRQEVLASIGLKEKVTEMVRLVVERSAQQTFFQDAEGFQGWFQKTFGFELDAAIASQAVAKQGDPQPALDLVMVQYEKREQEFTSDLMRQVERYLLLNAIDSRWKDHLHAIDALKAGIGLRGYAQVDPKNEYKREGFQLFEKLMHAIEEEVSSLILRIRVRHEEPPPTQGAQAPSPAPQPQTQAPRPPPRRQQVAVPATRAFDYFKRAQALNAAKEQQSAGAKASATATTDGAAPDGPSTNGSATTEPPLPSASAAPSSSAPAAASRPAVPAPKAARATQSTAQFANVGRNDPCPCGSGQKFKKCHGRGE
jgi:preprotein translocase subunit SecA